jgi:hypothetical protein
MHTSLEPSGSIGCATLDTAGFRETMRSPKNRSIKHSLSRAEASSYGPTTIAVNARMRPSRSSGLFSRRAAHSSHLPGQA